MRLFSCSKLATTPQLLVEVQSLLDSHEEPGEFLDRITPGFRSEAFAASSATRSRMGERIGAYRIVGVLGTGGMGDVFKAVRDDDQYQAEVAIKLMRADVRSSLLDQRFRTERQILAGLDHRNIARLLDGGTTAAGAPYVVMELVAGEPIDGYCEARNLAVRDRVQLFLQVCAAVSYAHQHLVVHRDLKPNNILVTVDGSVKLLDFGIAKLLDATPGPTVADVDGTATTLRAMTLEYASPEQVSGARVTTVSDVYSLGVVLYRLLTGKSPYRERATDAARMAEILGDSMPTRPSQVERRLGWRPRQRPADGVAQGAAAPLRERGAVRRRSAQLPHGHAGEGARQLVALPRRQVRATSQGRAGRDARSWPARCWVHCRSPCARHVSRSVSAVVAQQHFDSVRKLANTMLLQLHEDTARDSGSIRTREMMVKTSARISRCAVQAGGRRPPAAGRTCHSVSSR